MAIYAVGAYYDGDVSDDFIANNIAGPGWSINDAPELHQFVRSLKVGDIIYIKSFSPTSPDIIVKEILQNPPQCLVHVSMQWHPHRP